MQLERRSQWWIFCALCILGEKTSPGEDLFETLLFYIPLCIGPSFFRRTMANLYLEFSWGISNYHQHILSFLSFIHVLHTASLTSKRFSLYRAYLSFCPFFAFWLRLLRGNYQSETIETLNVFLIRIAIGTISWVQRLSQISLLYFSRQWLC